MIDLISLMIGFYVFMSLYHILIFLGRKKDMSNLSFAILNLAFLVNIFVLRVYPDSSFYNQLFFFPALAIASTLMGFSFNFFAYTIFDLRYTRRINIALIVLLILGNIILNTLYLTTRDMVFMVALFLIILGCLITFSLFSVLIFVTNHLHMDRKKKLILAGFIVMMIQGVVFLINDAILKNSSDSFIFHSGILAMALLFAYAMIDGFNRDHFDLLELKSRLEKKVLERTEQLEEANRQKTTFFINMAHETRTPLTLISNALDRFSNPKSSVSEIDIAKRNINKLIRDILNVLDLERFEKGKTLYNHEQSIELAPFIEQKLVLFGETALKAGLLLTFEPRCKAHVRIDGRALDRVLNNLLENAIKYNTPGGSVNIGISIFEERNQAILCVSDTGIGMEENQLEHIFEQFYQISRKKHEYQGMGIGLFLIKNIVEEAGGNLSVISEPGKGSEFTVTLNLSVPGTNADPVPVHDMSQPLDSSTHIQVQDTTLHDEAKHTVFVVEDNQEMLLLLQESLSAFYNFYSSQNGESALQKLNRIPKPDIVLSDVMMDIMDGLTFHKRFSGQEIYADVPFIFLTAKASHKEKILGLKSGAVDYITKPFSIRVLMAKMASLIKNREEQKDIILREIGENLYQFLTEKDRKSSTRNKSEQGRLSIGIFAKLESEFNMSKRELEIAGLIKKGFLYKEIAAQLNLSSNTVETYRKRIFKKCNIQNKMELLNILKN